MPISAWTPSTAVEIKNALESTFRISLPSSAVFDCPTIMLLTQFLDEQLVPDALPEDAAAHGVHALKAASAEDIEAELAALRSV